MKSITTDKKDILLAALQERYTAVHTIRERIQTVTLWIVGILLASSGWLFQSDLCLTFNQKIIFSIFSLMVWMILKFFFFNDLERGFNSQRVILAKVEDALGFFEKGYFTEEDESLYPHSWKKSGQKGCEGNFVNNNNNLLALGFLFFVVAIFFF